MGDSLNVPTKIRGLATFAMVERLGVAKDGHKPPIILTTNVVVTGTITLASNRRTLTGGPLESGDK